MKHLPSNSSSSHHLTIFAVMSSFQFFSKSKNRIIPFGGAAVALILSVASSLFAIEAYRSIILSSDLKVTHVQNPSSSSSNSSYAHVVSPDHMVDENSNKISSTSNANEPIFVLHIGPHKTATSVIQCDLTRYRQELYESAHVAYLGRTYSSCLKKRHRNKHYAHTVDPRSLIDSCFKNGGCKATDIWKRLESELAYLSAHNKHAILSDEAFARMHVTNRNRYHKDNRKMLFELVNKYYPGRMRVAVVYRRYYEWQLSLWNEFNKPFGNGNGDTSNYKRNYQNWPSEGGERCRTFQSYLENLLDPPEWRRSRNHTSNEYRHMAEASHVHAAQYFQQLWSNHSSEVQVLNLHKMNVNVDSDNGEDVTSKFLQSTLTPLAAKTYIRSKDSGFGGRHNPSRNINYDILAVAAYEHGLLAKQNIPRANVALLLEANLMKFMNTTDLPLQCPNEELLNRFLRKSLHYEELLYPGQSDEKEHETNFYAAVKKHKFCSFNFDALLADEDVRTFFAEEIPRLYRHSKH